MPSVNIIMNITIRLHQRLMHICRSTVPRMNHPCSRPLYVLFFHCLENDAQSCDLDEPQWMHYAAEEGGQACMAALLEFLALVPELSQAVGEDVPGSALTGCERDCKHLAFKALTLLQQVTCLTIGCEHSCNLPLMHSLCQSRGRADTQSTQHAVA